MVELGECLFYYNLTLHVEEEKRLLFLNFCFIFILQYVWGREAARQARSRKDGARTIRNQNQGQQFPELVMRVQKPLFWSHIYHVGHSFVSLT